MSVTKTYLPKRFHQAVVKWQETYLPDFDFLLEHWDKYFPQDTCFELCAFRELGLCNQIECGDQKGQRKFQQAAEMEQEQGRHLLSALKAQASTEFGSIQQHQLTLARAQDEEEQFWILRMMAEELRHGYQMFHLLLEDDWSDLSDQSGPEMVEEILSMQTGSHILGAFNVDFDSFIDNVTFCALIDRVGKYQLSMQRISAYKPMAESMPQMLREEAFHLAAGVVPLRRWMERAAKDSIYITTRDIQKAINKWLPRGLEMFGDERGGGTNVRYGLKPMKNAEAQEQYYVEVGKVVQDLNMRYIRARLPELSLSEAEALLRTLETEGGSSRGISWEDLVHMPHREFFRRRGVPAFKMIGWAGEVFDDAGDYLGHLARHLPDAYRAGRDFRDYAQMLMRVGAGELTGEDAARTMPGLRRVGGVCPCSRAVRWVVEESPEDGSGGNGRVVD
jgi:benzoyl-CoA 2,3-epoxidase subunit B